MTTQASPRQQKYEYSRPPIAGTKGRRFLARPTIYFALGLAGCLLIASGFLFWLESRRKRHLKLGLKGVAIVEGLTIGLVTGILIATAAFFVINRILPLDVTASGEDRTAIEIWMFLWSLGGDTLTRMGAAGAGLDRAMLVARNVVPRGGSP